MLKDLTRRFKPQPKSIDILVGSLATSFNSGGGFCAGSNEVVSHQRINSAALVFSAALPPLLATAASESIKILSDIDGVDRFERLRKNTRLLRELLKPITSNGDDGLVEIPSHEDSPLIHITLKSSFPPASPSKLKANINELSPLWNPRKLAGNQTLSSSFSPSNKTVLRGYEEEEELLQKVVDKAITEKNVLITRAKKVWDQEIDPMRPSLRICVSESLDPRDLTKAGNDLVELLKHVLSG